MTQSTTSGASATPLPSPEERRGLREAKSMSEKQVATAVGVTRSTIRSWEAGRTAPRGRKGKAYTKLLAGFAAELHEKAVRAEQAQQVETEARKAAEERSATRERDTAGAQDRAKTRPPARDGAARPAEKRDTGPPAPVKRGTGPSSGAATGVAGPALRAGPHAAGPGAGQGSAGSAGTVERTVLVAAGPGKSGDAVPGDGASGAAVSGAAASGAAVSGAGTAGDDLGPVLPATPDQAFDALYTHTAPGLVGQAFLLTGRRALSQASVERAFRLAWQRWPEVAVDRDPAGWVRAAAYEYAMSPWRRPRRGNKQPDSVPSELDGPGGRALREALLDLPPSYRRALLLYDGLGLDLPETAAETEASTPAVANRLLRAREAVADRLPELADSELLHECLDTLAQSVTPPSVPPARTVRTGGERRARVWTRTAIAFTVLIVGATSFTLATAPTQYEAPQAPGEQIDGVPVPNGPERLTKEDLKLRDKLRREPMKGPPRLLPEPL
ncbi:sigma factor-like helix-turn-helix DNA-binding protein [Streptomyces sp. AK02-01A]|uniref:sigma factor-like helix-turn-helix DNA-binding protein n=1 Tax=Streptomyces sp. AK02-01A TaxID=3028648 RepID=UPI0029A2A285|nr:sigma factor-like helix-turn-helix DNA-binding protein [Streptomyces sp. AK02-01A]MDX3852236.1 sigma factor-like helix-turn-helix DNA-binding protein [Streptomyces sp. AK02-01A]